MKTEVEHPCSPRHPQSATRDMVWLISNDLSTCLRVDEGLTVDWRWTPTASPCAVYQKAYHEGSKCLIRLRNRSQFTGSIQSFNNDGTVMLEDVRVRRFEEGRLLPPCTHRGVQFDAELIEMVCVRTRPLNQLPTGFNWTTRSN